MRTTLDIDEDVLAAVKELARRRRLPAGRMVSQLLRQGLTGQGETDTLGNAAQNQSGSTIGFRPFAAKQLVTNDQVNALRDDEGL